MWDIHDVLVGETRALRSRTHASTVSLSNESAPRSTHQASNLLSSHSRSSHDIPTLALNATNASMSAAKALLYS